MRQPRYSKLSSLEIGASNRKGSPTGRGFGGSDLKLDRLQTSAFPIVSSSVLMSNDLTPVASLQSAPLVVEVGKIVVVTIWFWCLIGANFCFEAIGSIVCYGTQDI